MVDAALTLQEPRGDDRQIVVRDNVARAAGADHFTIVARRERNEVRAVDRHHERFECVVTVRPASCHMQEKVELRGCGKRPARVLDQGLLVASAVRTITESLPGVDHQAQFHTR